MAKRFPYENTLDIGGKVLNDYYTEIEKQFHKFFPKIIQECKSQILKY